MFEGRDWQMLNLVLIEKWMSRHYDAMMTSLLTAGKASAQQVMIVWRVANIVESPNDKSIAKNKTAQTVEPEPT